MKPYIVLKDKYVRMITRRNLPPNVDVRASDRNLSSTHSNRSIEFYPRGENQRLGFYEKLLSKCIKWINVGILGRILRECIGIDGDMSLSQFQEFSSR
jgi:hypothetical protein